jgi:hypothetical protein
MLKQSRMNGLERKWSQYLATDPENYDPPAPSPWPPLIAVAVAFVIGFVACKLWLIFAG